MKNVQLVSFPNPSPGSIILPYSWMSFKSWYEDNGRNPNDWHWPTPLLTDNFKSIEQIVDALEAKGIPDVLLVSNYMWNFKLQDEVARLCKAKWPNTVIIYGGPQQTVKYDQFFFKNYPHVTAVASEGGYGEPVIAEILDRISEDALDLSLIPNIRYAGMAAMTKESVVDYPKKSFTWTLVVRRHLDYLKSVIKEFKENNPEPHFVVMIYEGSRGCPYGCTYCEWGLNTHSKINFKSVDLMKDDIDAILELDVNFLEFADANWGSRKGDVEIIQYLVDQRAGGRYPQSIHFYVAKNNKKYAMEVQQILLDANIHIDLVFSIQDQDLEVKEIIDRVDLDWDKLVSLYTPMLEKYKKHATVDLIIGLPGQTIDTHYNGYNKTLAIKRGAHPAFINDLLPVSPANDPEYKKKYQIETLEQHNLYQKFSWSVSNICFRKDEVDNVIPNHLMLADQYLCKIHNVVATSTFTRDDFLEMYMTDRMTYVLDGNDSLYGITRYLWKHLDVLPSVFVKSLWREFFNSTEYLPYIYPLINLCNQEFRFKLNQKSVENLEFFQWPSDKDMLFKVDLIFWIAVLINPLAFYQSLKVFLHKKGWGNSTLDSLINFTSSMVKTCDYNPEQGKTVITDYDWPTWLTNVNSIPEPSQLSIAVSDKTYSPQRQPIEWHTQDSRKQFSTMVFKISSSEPYSILFENIEI